METITRGCKQVALVISAGGKLAGTITDGDVRRAILRDGRLAGTAAGVMQVDFAALPEGAPVERVLALMRERRISHVPLVSPDRRPVDLAWIQDLVVAEYAPLEALVMAGGSGRRLMPLTAEVPKPMLPVGDRPLLELTIERLRAAGIRRVHVSTHYKAEKITAHFGDGREFGVDIRYLHEEAPLGTAGALGLIEPGEQPLLVINGDVLTGVDFRAMLAFHREQAACITVAVTDHTVRLPYGLVHADGVRVLAIEEKPRVPFRINAGIYLLSPEARGSVERGRRVEMTALIGRAIEQGLLVASFPVEEAWLDIGRPEDYARAQAAALAAGPVARAGSDER